MLGLLLAHLCEGCQPFLYDQTADLLSMTKLCDDAKSRAEDTDRLRAEVKQDTELARQQLAQLNNNIADETAALRAVPNSIHS